jgi:glucose/arabinose dehydrogenase
MVTAMRSGGRASVGAGVLLVAAAIALIASGATEAPISLPPGFRFDEFAVGLGPARALAIDPSGVVLVSVPAAGRVLALPDRDGDGRADDFVVVAAGLDLPHGLTFHRGALYVAETGRVLRFSYDPARLVAREASVVVPDLPAGEHHWTRSIAFGPDGRLYVAIGSSCDACRERDRRRAAIVRYEADGAGERLFATGLRNPVGLSFHPATGTLWTTVNERDWKSGGAPPDHVTAVRDGGDYGWPDCFALDGAFRPDPELAAPRACRDFLLPSLELPPHSAPLGAVFYTARQFPAAYRGSLLVALHGSRPELPPAGYKIVRVEIQPSGPPVVHDFVTGFRSWGRPVDLVVGRGGALFISDDDRGAIYRVSYRR